MMIGRGKGKRVRWGNEEKWTMNVKIMEADGHDDRKLVQGVFSHA